MKNIIKQIRLYSGLSQKEYADKLEISFATVNRWENGKAAPNKLAQMKIYDFCVENKIPLFDMIQKRIEDEVSDIESEPGRILLYHGSKSGIEGNIAPISRKRCDFGEGFYTGTNPIQPLTLVCDFPKSKFYIVSLKEDDLNALMIEPGIQWAMLVAYHRGKMEKINGTRFYEKYEHMADNYDFIIGSIANDRMFYVLDHFFLGNITDEALVKSLAALELGKQYVAVTQEGCNQIRIEKEIPLSYLEKKCLQIVSEENREYGISAANEICKKYRREGLFFDEILEHAAKEV